MRLYVAGSVSPVARALSEGYYVFDFANIVYKTSKGVFLYHNGAVEEGTNIVDVFRASYPDIVYQSVTTLPLKEAIVPLRKRIHFVTS